MPSFANEGEDAGDAGGCNREANPAAANAVKAGARTGTSHADAETARHAVIHAAAVQAATACAAEPSKWDDGLEALRQMLTFVGPPLKPTHALPDIHLDTPANMAWFYEFAQLPQDQGLGATRSVSSEALLAALGTASDRMPPRLSPASIKALQELVLPAACAASSRRIAAAFDAGDVAELDGAFAVPTPTLEAVKLAQKHVRKRHEVAVAKAC